MTHATHLYDLSSPPSFCSQRTSLSEIVFGGFASASLATRIDGLNDVLGAYEEVAYRTTVTALLVM